MRRMLFVTGVVGLLAALGMSTPAQAQMDQRTIGLDLYTSQGQLNKGVSIGTVKFHCPLVAGPVAWIDNPAPDFGVPPNLIDLHLTVGFGPVNYNKGTVEVRLSDSDPDRSEFIKVHVFVRAICADVE